MDKMSALLMESVAVINERFRTTLVNFTRESLEDILVNGKDDSNGW